MNITTKQELISGLQESRRVHLQALVDQFGNGGISYVAANIGKPASYVTRMLFPVGRKGKKPISEASVIALNHAFPGWLPEKSGLVPQHDPIPQKLETKPYKAHRYVQLAVRDGYLAKPDTLSCADCGAQAQVYDHRDYNKPLDVEPVCHVCNAKRGPAIPFRHVND